MATLVGLLRAINLGPQMKGRHAYFVYPDGIGTSKLTLTLIEKKLGTTGTARNWNTVLKLGALTEKP